MSVLDRDKKSGKKPSAVSQLIGRTEPEKTAELIYRSFYIEPHHVKALAYEKAETGRNLSEIVREALDGYFGNKLDQYKD